MLAGQVLGSAVFCVLKLSCTIKYLTQLKQKDSQLIYQLLLMCSCEMKCEMNGTSQGRGGFI